MTCLGDGGGGKANSINFYTHTLIFRCCCCGFRSFQCHKSQCLVVPLGQRFNLLHFHKLSKVLSHLSFFLPFFFQDLLSSFGFKWLLKVWHYHAMLSMTASVMYQHSYSFSFFGYYSMMMVISKENGEGRGVRQSL